MGDVVLLDISDRENPVVTERVRDTTNFAFWHSAAFNNHGTKVLFNDIQKGFDVIKVEDKLVNRGERNRMDVFNPQSQPSYNG